MARNYRELLVWQLGFQLRLHIRRMTQKCWKIADHDFIRDIRRSARSIPSNTAEGHGRFQPGDFHRYLEIAKSSLDETQNHLQAGLADRYFTQEDYDAALTLIRRITPAMTRLMAYLRSKEAKENAARIARTDYRTSRTKKNQ